MATVPRRGELSKDLRKFVKTRKTDLFCGLKSVISVFLFSSSEFKLAGEICQKPRTLDLVNLDPQSTVCNLHAHIWSHHPLLDFHTQITRKYSTAICLVWWCCFFCGAGGGGGLMVQGKTQTCNADFLRSSTSTSLTI